MKILLFIPLFFLLLSFITGFINNLNHQSSSSLSTYIIFVLFSGICFFIVFLYLKKNNFK
jgi:uncharacterized Rmd1/YagE family protein